MSSEHVEKLKWLADRTNGRHSDELRAAADYIEELEREATGKHGLLTFDIKSRDQSKCLECGKTFTDHPALVCSECVRPVVAQTVRELASKWNLVHLGILQLQRYNIDEQFACDVVDLHAAIAQAEGNGSKEG